MHHLLCVLLPCLLLRLRPDASRDAAGNQCTGKLGHTERRSHELKTEENCFAEAGTSPPMKIDAAAWECAA